LAVELIQIKQRREVGQLDDGDEEDDEDEDEEKDESEKEGEIDEEDDDDEGEKEDESDQADGEDPKMRTKRKMAVLQPRWQMMTMRKRRKKTMRT
jgi:ABC-type Zn2+ transport system substrate-binding protein/surface adhesin